MWIRFLILLIAKQCLCQWLIYIYYTFSTDIGLKTSISESIAKSFPYQVDLNEVLVNSSSTLQLQNEKINAVLDLTFSISISQTLKELANQYHFLLISPENIPYSYSDWQFFNPHRLWCWSFYSWICIWLFF
ncbi:unnamed protein product [Blepharisma stoltei]|uniref:Uncharacterized protein n=1 Tax=Blepharisma stoltei TaxID=1481888 RepID=A0AAU9I3W5_9CILI|nr:unnamed protein product [Blepharisma stoltei]